MVRYVLHGLLGLPERLTLFSSLSAATLLVELLHRDMYEFSLLAVFANPFSLH